MKTDDIEIDIRFPLSAQLLQAKSRGSLPFYTMDRWPVAHNFLKLFFTFYTLCAIMSICLRKHLSKPDSHLMNRVSRVFPSEKEEKLL